MARKSRWQQFADNFNSVYGSFTNVAKGIEGKKVMDEEYTDANGIALTGADLDRRRYEELAKVYTKYGDAAGGLQMRSNLAQIESANRDNDINQSILQELVYQRGEGATRKLDSETNQNNASATNLTSQAGARDAKLSYELTGLGLDNAGKVTSNAQAEFDLGLDRSIRPELVRKATGEADSAVGEGLSAMSNAAVDQQTEGARASSVIAESIQDQNAAMKSTETLTSDIDATNAGNVADAAQSRLSGLQSEIGYDQLSAEEQLLIDVNNGDFETPEEAEAAYIEGIRSNPNISPERKVAIIKSVNDIGLTTLQGRAATIAQEASNSLQTGGLDGLVTYYDGVDDGNTLQVVRNGGNVSIVETRGDQKTTLFSGSEAAVTDKLMAQIARPGTGLEVAAAEANIANTNAKTELIGEQTFTEMLSQSTELARASLLEAQATETEASIKSAGGGLGKQQEIANKGLADLMGSTEYQILRQDNMEAADEMVGDFMRRFEINGAPPVGVPASDWFAMTDEEQAAFK